MIRQLMRVRFVIALGALSAVLGFIGWRLLGNDLADSAYRTIALFVIDFDRPEGSIPWPLQVARFTALLTTTWAAILVFVGVLGRWFVANRAARLTEPTLILGGGREVPRLAASINTTTDHPVVVIGDLEPTVAAGIRRLGARVMTPIEGAGCLTKVVNRAGEIFVIGRDDRESLALARTVRDSTQAQRYPTRVLFDSSDLTTLWNDDETETRGGVSRSAIVAAHVLRKQPVYREGSVSSPAIVIGDGPIASEVLRGSVRGWQQPGEIMEIHAIGHDRTWFDEALVELSQRVNASWTEVPGARASVTREVSRLINEWIPPRRADRFTIEGPSIVISYADETVTGPIADQLAVTQPKARITAVVDSAREWVTPETRPNLTFVGSDDLLVEHSDLMRGRIDALCDEIVAELSRWPASRTVIAAIERPGDGGLPVLAKQPEETRKRIRAIADNLAEILAAGNIGLGRHVAIESEPILNNPSELIRMADALGELVPPVAVADPVPSSDEHGAADAQLIDRDMEARVRRLEFAARLSTMAARAGFLPHRPKGISNDLSPGQIQRLALRAHAGYLDTAKEYENATRSDNWNREWSELEAVDRHSNLAQIFDAPVKLAMLGLTWRTSDEPVVHTFNDDEIELLAELEHRRWHHFQNRNGRYGHDWAKPWFDLEEDVKSYDRVAVRLLPAMLALEGLEIVPFAESGPDTSPR